jgi:hypothetical protein
LCSVSRLCSLHVVWFHGNRCMKCQLSKHILYFSFWNEKHDYTNLSFPCYNVTCGKPTKFTYIILLLNLSQWVKMYDSFWLPAVSQLWIVYSKTNFEVHYLIQFFRIKKRSWV